MPKPAPFYHVSQSDYARRTARDPASIVAAKDARERARQRRREPTREDRKPRPSGGA